MKKEEVEIIRRLIKNPRESYAKVAKEVDMSPEGVRQKVLRMRKEGILRFYCVPNGRYFGKRRITMILSLPGAEKAAIVEKLKALPQTIEMRSGVLSSTAIVDIATEDADRDIHELTKLFSELGVEVREVFESEQVHFDSKKIMRENPAKMLKVRKRAAFKHDAGS